MRALELIIRSLITDRYEDQPALVARLKDLLSEKVVQQWLTSADRGDVLSGTTFSELSSLFVSAQEYPNYDPLYKDTPLLSLLKEKRVTIRNYLDDIRRIRNVLVRGGFTTLDVIAVGLLVVSVFEVLLSGLRSYVFAHTTSIILRRYLTSNCQVFLVLSLAKLFSTGQ